MSENNTTAPALTDEQIIELLTAMDDAGFTQAERNNDRLRNASRSLLTSPRAAVPLQLTDSEKASIDRLTAIACSFPEHIGPSGAWSRVNHGDLGAVVSIAKRALDAAPTAPVAEAEPAPDPLRRRVERLLVELHAEGRLSESQCLRILDIPREDWRALAEFLAPAAQAVAADGDALKEAVTRTIDTIRRQLELIFERAPGNFLDKVPVVQSLTAHKHRLEKALAVKQRAAVSPATAEPTDYAAIEREHFGDPDKRTGIYAPATADERAAHPDCHAKCDVCWGENGERWPCARASQAAAPADAREPFPYQKTFDAIAAATSITAGGHVSISVKAFRKAFGAIPADAGEAVLAAVDRAVLAQAADFLEQKHSRLAAVTLRALLAQGAQGGKGGDHADQA
ncbi:hypothetical protein [Burkholderia glumae]|uniref:hypothetical protein n=1 Tax=Burkholderia glumae TaxID=337 RepID=UPI00214F6EB5|nr:hypothetical protein [Burkholderia glumae]